MCMTTRRCIWRLGTSPVIRDRKHDSRQISALLLNSSNFTFKSNCNSAACLTPLLPFSYYWTLRLYRTQVLHIHSVLVCYWFCIYSAPLLLLPLILLRSMRGHCSRDGKVAAKPFPTLRNCNILQVAASLACSACCGLNTRLKKGERAVAGGCGRGWSSS
jgi:hypothetical protein